MPIVSEIIWRAVPLNVVFPLLFISASTPAIAMYINPPAVNPCQKGDDSHCQNQLTTNQQTHYGTFLTSIRDDCPGSFPQSRAYTKSSDLLFPSMFGHTNNEGQQIKKRERGAQK